MPRTRAGTLVADFVIEETGDVRVCVFCGSNRGSSPSFAVAAAELGVALAEAGMGLVYGGGAVGLMGVVADAVLDAGGEVIGVMPEGLVAREIAHRRLTELRVTHSMHERKAEMAARADAFVALPGGLGTFEELCEILTWGQLGLHTKPVVLLDVEGYWTPFFDLLDGAVAAGFLRPAHRELARRADSVAATLALIASPPPAPVHKWIDEDTT
jgi:uncharacterized protein (TIGR00730 family)